MCIHNLVKKPKTEKKIKIIATGCRTGLSSCVETVQICGVQTIILCMSMLVDLFTDLDIRGRKIHAVYG